MPSREPRSTSYAPCHFVRAKCSLKHASPLATGHESAVSPRRLISRPQWPVNGPEDHRGDTRRDYGDVDPGTAEVHQRRDCGLLRLTDFVGAAERVAIGGTALDPEIVHALVRSKSGSGLDALSERGRDVLGLVAVGLQTARLPSISCSERTVETHIRSVFTKLGLHSDSTTHRRVLAVVKYLETR
jgi:DNA-binding CsgD family transcriptional regulator